MATPVVTSTAAQPPVTAQLVGNAFVQQYYHILCTSPGLVYRFYQDISKLGRPEGDGTMSITTTMHAINEKIMSLNYGGYRAEVKSVRSQESFHGGVQVLVTGDLVGKENTARTFVQTFFLAPQDKGYFVLNDIFEYVETGSTAVTDGVVPIAAEPVLSVPPRSPTPPPVQENNVSEESTPSADEAITGEVYDPSENGDVPIVKEEAPVAEVIDEIQNDQQIKIESSVKIEDTPKKSYASIVMDLKEKNASFTPPVAARKVQPKIVEPASSTVAATIEPVPNSELSDSATNQEGEAEGFSIYIKGLPMNANNAMLEEVFKHFGTIKTDGIQVRSNRGFCFGFVEYEEASSVEKALEASPVMIGGRQTVVEEKRSTFSRGNNRGRYQNGRGSGYRNDGGRGRGSYGNARNYNNRGDFNGRGEFVNRGGSRGGASNREGYQRSENFTGTNGGGRMNRNGGMANGSVKSITHRVPATA